MHPDHSFEKTGVVDSETDDEEDEEEAADSSPDGQSESSDHEPGSDGHSSES